MNNTQKIAIPVLVAGTAIAAVMTTRSYNNDLYNRFPEYDRKIVRKAYRRLMLKSLSGKLDQAMLTSDDGMDMLFIAEVENLTESNK